MESEKWTELDLLVRMLVAGRRTAGTWWVEEENEKSRGMT